MFTFRSFLTYVGVAAGATIVVGVGMALIDAAHDALVSTTAKQVRS